MGRLLYVSSSTVSMPPFLAPYASQRNYFHAVLEASKSVADKLRAKTGKDGDGSALVDATCSLNYGLKGVNGRVLSAVRRAEDLHDPLTRFQFARVRLERCRPPGGQVE